MNSAVFILAIVGAVLCGPGGDNGRGGRGGPGARGGPGGHHGGPPFLQNVTDEARQEFFSILHNKNETTEQHKAELLTWAEKYGILVGTFCIWFAEKCQQMLSIPSGPSPAVRRQSDGLWWTSWQAQPNPFALVKLVSFPDKLIF